MEMRDSHVDFLRGRWWGKGRPVGSSPPQLGRENGEKRREEKREERQERREGKRIEKRERERKKE